MRLRYARQALADLHDISTYISHDSPRVASRVVGRIRDAVLMLQGHPRIGRPGRVEGTRELPVRGLPFVVAYRVQADTVDVLSVVHTARLWPERF